MSYELDPPPSIVELVKDNQGADSIWKRWFNNFYEWSKDNMSKDFFFEVSQGNVSGHTAVVLQGHNPDINGTGEDIWSEGGLLTHLTTASTIRIQAGGNAADTAAGVGAQTVYVWGLDANYIEINDTIVTAGASASAATTNTYLRVFGAQSTIVGSGGVNTGDITIEAVTGGTTQSMIAATEGTAHQAFYTVPANKTMIVWGGSFGALKGSGATGPGAGGSGTAGLFIKGYTRIYNESSANNYESWLNSINNLMSEGGSNPNTLTQLVSNPLPEKADFRASASSDDTNMEVTGRIYLILVDN